MQVLKCPRKENQPKYKPRRNTLYFKTISLDIFHHFTLEFRRPATMDCFCCSPPFGPEICSDICPLTLSVSQSEQFSRSSMKTVSVKEQIMSKDKESNIFFKSNGIVVFVIFPIFFAACELGNITRIFPRFSWVYSVT